MIGSRKTAAVASSTAAASASTSPYGTCTTSPGSGANGSCLAGWPVSASEPIVRPWKAPWAATSFVRPVSRVILKATSLASVPELQKNTRAVGAQQADERLGQRDARFGGIEVRRVAERVHLAW